jgi:hypothetical protein
MCNTWSSIRNRGTPAERSWSMAPRCLHWWRRQIPSPHSFVLRAALGAFFQKASLIADASASDLKSLRAILQPFQKHKVLETLPTSNEVMPLSAPSPKPGALVNGGYSMSADAEFLFRHRSATYHESPNPEPSLTRSETAEAVREGWLAKYGLKPPR